MNIFITEEKKKRKREKDDNEGYNYHYDYNEEFQPYGNFLKIETRTVNLMIIA